MIKPTNALTAAKIRSWANKKTKQDLLPQLHDLTVVAQYGELLVSLASDKDCPQRLNILNCLYSYVGKSVSQHATPDFHVINDLLDKAAQNEDTIILNWVARSRVILRDLKKYDYVEWCGGGFVEKDLA